MSRLVNAYMRDDNGEMVFLDPSDDSEKLAGFESFRKTFYGGRTARSLGLRLFPSLAEGDLYVEGSDLARLRDEAEVVRQNIRLFVKEADADIECLVFRIENVIRAIGRAQKANGSVVIW